MRSLEVIQNELSCSAMPAATLMQMKEGLAADRDCDENVTSEKTGIIKHWIISTPAMEFISKNDAGSAEAGYKRNILCLLQVNQNEALLVF